MFFGGEKVSKDSSIKYETVGIIGLKTRFTLTTKQMITDGF